MSENDIEIVVSSSGKVRYQCKHDHHKKKLCSSCRKRLGEQIKKMVEQDGGSDERKD